MVLSTRCMEKGDCNSFSEMKVSLDGLQQTAEYRCCPRGRQLLSAKVSVNDFKLADARWCCG